MSHFTVLVIGDRVKEKLAPYNENSNSTGKWDWYQVGGRWAGIFVLKAGCKGVIGEISLVQPVDMYSLIEENRVSQARMGDIDWDKTQTVSPDTLEYYNAMWDFVEGKITKEQAIAKGVVPYFKEYFIKTFGSREESIRREGTFATFAVITEDGKWHKNDSDDEGDWICQFFDRFLKDLPSETMLTVLDCHL